jgi:hypothetical protein
MLVGFDYFDVVQTFAPLHARASQFAAFEAIRQVAKPCHCARTGFAYCRRNAAHGDIYVTHFLLSPVYFFGRRPSIFLSAASAPSSAAAASAARFAARSGSGEFMIALTTPTTARTNSAGAFASSASITGM